MLSLGSLAFGAPWFLAALAALPILWWLLRTTPPVPQRIRFPAIRLLFGLTDTEESPARTPLWLLLLRMALAALIIVALARPALDAGPLLRGAGPMVLVVDNGWAAGPGWEHRRAAIANLLGRAEQENRLVGLIETAPSAQTSPPAPPQLAGVEAVRERADALAPQPWPVNRDDALTRIEDMNLPGSTAIVWLTDGIEDGAGRRFADALDNLANLTIIAEPKESLPLLLFPPADTGRDLKLELARPAGGGERDLWLRATDQDGALVTRIEAKLPAGEVSVTASLPPEQRNRIKRIEIEGAAGAGGVILLDDRWQRRGVGLVSGRSIENAQPLLSDLFYLERALAPYSDVDRGNIRDLIAQDFPILVLADVGTLTDPEVAMLSQWIESGGVLVRFAGPRVAEGADDLMPVRLRRGDRALGGAMSWSEPARLAPFPAVSPFFGLAIPDEVVIQRQILAEPTGELADRTWARLADGTPLVTGAKRGDGWLVLAHTTANADWSTLPLSGLFVDMLRRLVDLGDGRPGRADTMALAPAETLDGFGRLGPAPATAHPIEGGGWASAAASPRHPPGYYGSAADGTRRALNLSASLPAPKPLSGMPEGASRIGYEIGAETNLAPSLFAAALILAIADLIASLVLRGLLSARRTRIAAVIPLIVGIGLAAGDAARAQQANDPFSPEAMAKRASLDIRLGYVLTGVPKIDEISDAGLRGLGVVLTRRSSVEPEAPMAVDIETDELSVFPLLYWPITTGQTAPSPETVSRLNAYLRNGGMILFDTRERAPDAGGGRAAARVLRRLVDGLDIPPLTPVPPNHVLTKSFYLLSEFPGRWQGGTVWVENDPQVNDGVSSVIVGANDWAGAWAVDATGRPMLPVVPGGEEQREMAYRFGVNVVMYALTGNYKADQVHIPAIMERLGL